MLYIRIEYDGGSGEHYRKFTIEADLGEGHAGIAGDVIKKATELLATHDPAVWTVTPSDLDTLARPGSPP